MSNFFDRRGILSRLRVEWQGRRSPGWEKRREAMPRSVRPAEEDLRTAGLASAGKQGKWELHVEVLQERTTFPDSLHQLVSGSSPYLNLHEAGGEGQQVADTFHLSLQSHHSQYCHTIPRHVIRGMEIEIT